MPDVGGGLPPTIKEAYRRQGEVDRALGAQPKLGAIRTQLEDIERAQNDVGAHLLELYNRMLAYEARCENWNSAFIQDLLPELHRYLSIQVELGVQRERLEQDMRAILLGEGARRPTAPMPQPPR